MIPIKPRNTFWSDEQWEAIYAREKSILVNAGAGSGKTAVLTQRIIEILKSGIKLEKLVVLTFTKAAASEMKERVRKGLTKLVKDNPKLQTELDYLDQSQIQTFDAFALGLVKKYHYLLGVSKSINIGDKVLLSMKRKEIINEVFTDYYNSKDRDFYDFVSKFTLKNDNLLQEYIYNICFKIDLLTSTEEFLDDYLENYYNEDIIDKRVNEFIGLINYDLERIKIRLKNLDRIVRNTDLKKFVEGLHEALAFLISSDSYDEILANIDVKYPRIPGKTEFEEKKIILNYEVEQIKDLVKKIKKNLIYKNIDKIKEEIIKTKTDVEVIIRILKEVDKRFWNFKKSLNIFGFNDVSKLAILLFKENQELREYYQNNLYEILIDEYQDTSDIQEILISLIANNNVYMVGDMKQSIYRFRNANPDIFKDKYELFKKSKDYLAIDLSKNYRSRNEVIDNINSIFSKIMSSEIGGVDYNDDHALMFGNLKYSENNANDNYNIEILTYDIKEDEFKKYEKEAFIIARNIKDKLSSKYQIYDKDEKIIRDCRYSDFVILASEKANFEIYKKIFEYFKLPLLIHKEEDFIRSNEIYVIKNILKAIYSLNDKDYYQDNFKDSVLSILRSFLIEANDQEISKLFCGDFDEGLNLLFPKVWNSLMKISKNVQKSTLRDILAEIYKEFDVYYNIIKIGNVEEIENKLNYLLIKFSELDNINYNLFDSINYLEELMSSEFDIEYLAESNIDKNMINMMSIHKSKGLEFSVCYYCGLASKFKMKETNDRIIFDKKYGFIFPIFNEGLKDTILKSLLKQKLLVEEISERLRLLYVALTRAKEKMILVCEEFGESLEYLDEVVPHVEKLNYNSFYSIFNSLKKPLSDKIIPVLVKGTEEYKGSKTLVLESTSTSPVEYKSVSIKLETKEKHIASTKLKQLSSKEQIEIMEFGTRVHEYFELLDYKQNLQEQLKDINLDEKFKSKIYKFYDLDIFKQNILNIYHEYQFSYINEFVNYQGIIDFIIELDDKIIIIDFKLSNLEKEEYRSQLKVYYDFLKTITNKKISAYLYSIIREELKLIIEGDNYL